MWLAPVQNVTTEWIPGQTSGSHRAPACEGVVQAGGTVDAAVQYSIFRPNWMVRGPLASVTAPKPQENDPLHPGLPAAMNGEVIGVAHAPPLAW